MTTSAPFITEIAGGIATVTLTRPEIHNAFDDELVARLTREFQGLSRDTVVRVVILASTGKSFCAGADVNWMKRMAEFGQEENLEDAKALAGLMFTLASLRKPTIAAVQGSAFGGGVGLVAACDIDPTRLRTTATQFAIPHTYADGHQMLDAEELDILYSIVPAFARTDVEATAAARGIHHKGRDRKAGRVAAQVLYRLYPFDNARPEMGDAFCQIALVDIIRFYAYHQKPLHQLLHYRRTVVHIF